MKNREQKVLHVIELMQDYILHEGEKPKLDYQILDLLNEIVALDESEINIFTCDE